MEGASAAAVGPELDAEHEECSSALKRSFVQEWKILEGLVDSMVSSNGAVPMSEIKRAQTIMEKYQEQGQLLEPHLEGMVCPLMGILRSLVDDTGNPKMDVVKKLFSVIHTLVTVCGYKTVVKFFPHQAADLELAVTLLQCCHGEVQETSILREESTGQWETKCCLLLWLSILVLIPFDLVSVDTSLAGSNVSPTNEIPPLVERMLVLCKGYLASAGPMREMAGVLLSRLLTRPDMQVALTSFMTWTQEAISAALDNPAGDFLVPGIIGAVAAIFKVGGNDLLYQVTPTVWQAARELSKSPTATRSLVLRKFLVKLIQRVGLVYLPPRITSWRYRGVVSVIGQNLSYSVCNSSDIELGDSKVQQRHDKELIPDVELSNEKFHNIDEEDYDVPEVVEDIIEHLLASLKDKDTVVHWSGAKGIGRITARLNSSFADEVVASVLELFSPTEGDGAWHGGCLALAELARRGLLIPMRLHEVVPLIVKALHYDVRRGAHSIGAHVRDAAAYVCWAFARAYPPTLMREHLKQLAPALLCIACYDREVNCRRAASAAFQENVGRQGDYPHGIDLVNATDYFALSSRSNAYCSVAPYVAQFVEYRIPMVEELLHTKICHWDRGLRERTAEALALLVQYDIVYFGGPILETLLPWILAADLNLRHGATLAIAELILSLRNNGFTFSEESKKALAGIVPSIERARLYRGKGGEIMRAAVSRLIECEALVGIPLSPKIQKGLLDTINENLKHPNDHIQVCAVAALRAFIQGYLIPANSQSIANVTSKYLKILQTDLNPAARRGAALALSALPPSFLAPLWKDILNALCTACFVEENPDERDAETRVNAVRGLVAVCKSLLEAGHEYFASSMGDESPIYTIKEQVMECLFRALDDYSVDNRGDVGSWVREAAIEGLEQCTILLCRSLIPSQDEGSEPVENDKVASIDGVTSAGCQISTETLQIKRSNIVSFNSSLALRVIGGLVKQALEKINRVRDTAGRTLRTILHNKSIIIPFIPHNEELKLLVPEEKNINWGAPAVAFARLMPLLKFPEYRIFVMSGVVVSVGGLADSLAKISLDCLLEFLKSDSDPDAQMGKYIQRSFGKSDDDNWLWITLVSILKAYAGVDRVITPTFKTIDILWSKGVFSNEQNVELVPASEILASVKTELKGSRDFVKIMSGINVLGHLASMPPPTGMESVSQLLGLLGHRYPKVRKMSAEQVYLLLVQKGEDLLKLDDLNTAQELVSETCWDGPIENIRIEIEKLAGLLNIQMAQVSALKNSSNGEGYVMKPSIRDENASYAALVSDIR